MFIRHTDTDGSVQRTYEEIAQASVREAMRLKPSNWLILRRDSYTGDPCAWVADPGYGFLPVTLEYVRGEAKYECVCG